MYIYQKSLVICSAVSVREDKIVTRHILMSNEWVFGVMLLQEMDQGHIDDGFLTKCFVPPTPQRFASSDKILLMNSFYGRVQYLI